MTDPRWATPRRAGDRSSYLGARLTPGQSVLALVVFALLQGLGAALFYTWRPFI
jgi:hypothetical protein